MKNKGQTTIFFTMIICVIILFTLTAIEVGRIHMGKTKIRSVVHSTTSAIMADYNRELFETYQLLFIDPTYGTGSDAVAEEKVKDYLEESLNQGKSIYEFEVEEIYLAHQKGILSDDMKQVKEQIMDYQKTAGVISGAKQLAAKLTENATDVESAAEETDTNGVALNIPSKEEEEQEKEVEDPREPLQSALQFGILDVVYPGNSYSKETIEIEEAPSASYQQMKGQEKDCSFESIDFLKRLLFQSATEEEEMNLIKNAAFADYVCTHFSNAVDRKENGITCEIEYILEGEQSDYSNVSAVVNNMIWMRMPINYAYLLTDTEKRSEALTLATGICVATHTEALIEIVKYLLLGCWAYGESICEMKTLLTGGEIEYIKTGQSWITDLEAPVTGTLSKKIENGLSYSDYLMILLASKTGRQENICYARMLDVIQVNISQQYEHFLIRNCVGGMTIQGKIRMNSLLIEGKPKEVYDYYFEEEFSYSLDS